VLRYQRFSADGCGGRVQDAFVKKKQMTHYI
jgi:hypothetical protein